MNPYETNTTPRQRCEQRVLGAIIARPWLWERATASGLDVEHIREPGHRDVMNSILLVAESMRSTPKTEYMIQSVARWADAGSLGGVPVADGLAALKLIAEQDLGPGRREDVRALAMLLDDIDTLRGVDPPTAAIEDGRERATVDLDDLERKARAATPGPWRACGSDRGGCQCRLVWSIAADDTICQVERCEAPGRKEDVDHIAANSPPVTLALITNIRHATIQLDFYKRRCELLQSWQGKMRDPERTIVCDILANGATLPDPDGTRYGTGKAKP